MLFVDASSAGLYHEGKNKNYLRLEDILRVTAVFNAWNEGGLHEDAIHSAIDDLATQWNEAVCMHEDRQLKAAEGQAPIAPPNLRAGAISVPELVLPDGKRLTRGGPVAPLSALGPRAQSGPTAIERIGDGQRESRTYRYAGMEFVVVTAGDQIMAIYR